MSHLAELIAELCPDGVQFAPLSDLVRIRNGKDYKALGEGPVPVYGTGGVMRHVDTAAHPGPSVLIPRKGSLDKLYYVETPFWTVDTIFYTEIGDRLVPKFLYYHLLTQHLEELNQAGGVPSLTQSVLNLLPVPVPPLEVQQEIVRILDQFTQSEAKLEAELEAELVARSRRYAHFQQLAFLRLHESAVRKVPLREVGTWYGGGTPSKSRRDYWDSGTIPWISPKDMGRPTVSSTEDYITETAVAESATKLVPKESVALVVRSSILNHTLPIAFVPVEAALNQDMKAVVAGPGITPRYLFHALRAHRVNLLRVARRSGGSVGSLESGKLWTFEIPVPRLDEQERLVALLDNFDTCVEELRGCLTAELAARRKQYEYYRDQLLAFKEAPNE